MCMFVCSYYKIFLEFIFLTCTSILNPFVLHSFFVFLSLPSFTQCIQIFTPNFTQPTKLFANYFIRTYNEKANSACKLWFGWCLSVFNYFISVIYFLYCDNVFVFVYYHKYKSISSIKILGLPLLKFSGTTDLDHHDSECISINFDTAFSCIFKWIESPKSIVHVNSY